MERKTKIGPGIAKIARGAVITALGAALLMISYPFEALDLTMASLVSMLVWIMRLEYGGVFAVGVYCATALLGFLITPGNAAVVCYALVFGWFPVFKALLERNLSKKWLILLIKLLAVTAAFALMITIFFGLFVGEISFESVAKELSSFFSIDSGRAGWFEERVLFDLNRLQWMLIGAYLIFAPIITFIYDLLLSKFALVYIFKIRPILVKAHIFGERPRR